MNDLPRFFVKAVVIPAAIVLGGLLYAGLRYLFMHSKKEA